jgi:hypothetical protein
MIPKLSLDLDKLGAGRGAWLEDKSCLLKLGIQAALGLPSKRTALPRLVLGELARDLVKLDALVELCQGLFLLGVLLALLSRLCQ